VASVLRPCRWRTPAPGGQLRWHVHDLLAVREQAHGDVPADPLQPSTAQTRSGHCFGRPQHGGVARLVGAEAAAVEHVSSGAITSMVTDRLCGSMPMTTRVMGASSARARWDVEQGGQRYFELCRPLLSLSLLSSARPAQAK
jgi:hypothetical protein